MSSLGVLPSLSAIHDLLDAAEVPAQKASSAP